MPGELTSATARTVVRHLEWLGYRVSVFVMSGVFVRNDGETFQVFNGPEYVESHAVKGGDLPQLAKCEGVGDEAQDNAACLLPQAVGVELEDG